MIIASIIAGTLVALGGMTVFLLDPVRKRRIDQQHTLERERLTMEKEEKAVAILPSDSVVKEAHNKVKIAQAETLVKREEMIQAHLDKAKESLELTEEMEKLALLPPTKVPTQTKEVAKQTQALANYLTCPACMTANYPNSTACAKCGRTF